MYIPGLGSKKRECATRSRLLSLKRSLIEFGSMRQMSETKNYLGWPRVAPNLFGSARLWCACLKWVLLTHQMSLVPRVQILNDDYTTTGISKQPSVRVPDYIASAVAVVSQYWFEFQAGLVGRCYVPPLKDRTKNHYILMYQYRIWYKQKLIGFNLKAHRL